MPDVTRQNPFSPTFGASPPLLAGRDPIIGDFEEAIETGPRHPDYTALLIAARGMGKTVLLNTLEDRAMDRGWEVIADDTSTRGMPARLEDAAREVLERLHGRGRSVTGVGLGPVRVQPAEPVGVRRRSLRRLLAEVGDRLDSRNAGLLITLDELHNADVDEVREFGAIIQHVTRREGRPVAFVGAGLNMIEDTILSGTATTFFQRCSRFEIGRLSATATQQALARPIEESGSSIGPEALAKAVAASSGYPFMVQLVGFHAWRQAKDPARGIESGDVEAGVPVARRRAERLILEPVWKDLSKVDRRFLRAMAEDDGVSRPSDIAERLGKGTDYARVYRNRLRKAGMVIASARGEVDFAQTFARDWVRRTAHDQNSVLS